MSLPQIYLHGVKINPINRMQFLQEFKRLVDTGTSGQYVVTPYSEYIINAQTDDQFMTALNEADISIADGVYIQWSTKFMSLPVNRKGLLGKLTVFWQYVYTGASIVFNRKAISTVVPEKIPGSQVAYDLAEMAAKNDYKLAILGGFDFGSGNTGVLAANKLEKLYPGLQVVEVYPGSREKEEDGEEVVEVMRNSGADILFCCYSPKREEIWMHENLERTGIKVGIGLGGTIDYISGQKKAPPAVISKLGLEWLFRPFFADGYSLKAMWKRMKRGWFPAMLKSSTFSLRKKLEEVK